MDLLLHNDVALKMTAEVAFAAFSIRYNVSTIVDTIQYNLVKLKK